MFRYVKEDFILTDYSSNDHTTRSVLSIKQFQKKVQIMRMFMKILGISRTKFPSQICLFSDDAKITMINDVLRMWVFTRAVLEMNLAGVPRERKEWFTSVWSKVGFNIRITSMVISIKTKVNIKAFISYAIKN